MQEYNDGHDVEVLIIGGDSDTEKVGIFAGIGNPWDEVIGAPVGSSFFKTSGDKYRKTGAGDTMLDWTLGLDPNAGTGGGNQCIPFFLASGVMDNIPLSSGEIPFFLANGSYNSIPIISCS